MSLRLYGDQDRAIATTHASVVMVTEHLLIKETKVDLTNLHTDRCM